MSDTTRGTGAAPGPPWSVDVLADLHAGALDARQSAALWAQVNRDPEAQAVLAALDSVRHDLDGLGDGPFEPMPAHFAAQLDAAIAAEAVKSRPAQALQAQPGMAPVTNLAEARRKRNRRMGWAAGVLTAAAAAVAVTFVALPDQQTGGTPQAGDATRPPIELNGNNLSPAIGQLQGEKDFGPFEDESGLMDCLAEHDIEDVQVIGAREVVLDDEEGVGALLTPGGEGKRFRLVVVDPSCELIANTPLG